MCLLDSVFFVNCFVMFIFVGLCVFALLGYGLWVMFICWVMWMY